MRNPTQIPIVVVLVAGAILVHGCIRDDNGVAPAKVQTALPGSPQHLMDEFARVYAAMDLEGYAALLDEDFIRLMGWVDRTGGC